MLINKTPQIDSQNVSSQNNSNVSSDAHLLDPTLIRVLVQRHLIRQFLFSKRNCGFFYEICLQIGFI